MKLTCACGAIFELGTEETWTVAVQSALQRWEMTHSGHGEPPGPPSSTGDAPRPDGGTREPRKPRPPEGEGGAEVPEPATVLGSDDDESLVVYYTNEFGE